MRYWRIFNDELIDCGEVDKLGSPLDNPSQLNIPKDYDGPIAITRGCFSVGDWGIISGLPYALKQIYPKCQVLFPNSNWIQHVFGRFFEQGWGKNIWEEPWNNPGVVLKNNPYIDLFFDVGEIEGEVFTDHQRVYSPNSEPLVEQMLRFLGASENEIKSIDSRPQLFFTNEEEKIGDQILSTYIKDKRYGTLLVASSIPSLPIPWSKEIEHGIIEEVKQNKDLTYFYYCQDDIENTSFNFIKGINIKDLNIPVRIQLYLKTKAYINIGYQSGINDSVGTRTTKIVTSTPYDDVGSNIGRGTKYYFKDGLTKTY